MTIIQIIILAALLLVGLVATVIAIVQYQRCTKLEYITNTVVGHFEEINRLIRESDSLIENPKLKEAFAHDDEVGGFFQNLEKMQAILKEYIPNEEEVK